MSNYLGEKELSKMAVQNKIAKLFRKIIRGRLIFNEYMSSHTSFRIGGKASFFVCPKDGKDLKNILELCRNNLLRVFIIGHGTNLLVSDKGFYGCIIDLTETFRMVIFQEERIWAGSGICGSDLVDSSTEHSLDGLQNHSGIPGSFGGWLSLNAGAFRSSISEFVESVEVIDFNGREEKLTKDQIGFGYRQAPGLKDKIIKGAWLELKKGDKKKISDESQSVLKERYRRNVMQLPSAGSVFKNPPGLFAAKLIESIGGRKLISGGVRVSEKHSNIILNLGNGLAADVVHLVRIIREMVFKKYGVFLELELHSLGINWNEI
ncbi:UDP-N-acetylmuramate dehydrogenase [bacterium]|nr:UDP-N-acetylmuramate dehydrogenase [bacterium]